MLKRDPLCPQAQLAWTPEQYLEAWRREKRRERGGERTRGGEGTRGGERRKRERRSFAEEEPVMEGEEEEELIHVVADGEKMRTKKVHLGERENGNRIQEEEEEEEEEEEKGWKMVE